MDYKIKFTVQAKQDLKAIHHYYLNEFSEKTARKVIRSLRKAANLLSFSPEGGINFDERIGKSLYQEPLRMLISKQYLLFYLVQESEVKIMRIIRSETDYLNHLEDLFKNFK